MISRMPRTIKTNGASFHAFVQIAFSRCLGGNVQLLDLRGPSQSSVISSCGPPCQPYFQKSGRAEGTGSHDTFHRSPHQPAAVRENSRWEISVRAGA